jgi:methylenetetrahydrofolate dehydrogenase (NADP+)/methenyltetrahydrofolate cyclohydrolase
MTARILYGKIAADLIKGEVKKGVGRLKEDFGVTPSLSVIVIGDNQESNVCTNNKFKACCEVGINWRVIRLSFNTLEKELITYIESLNMDPSVHGILIQLPLPEHIDNEKMIEYIRPDKDVNGFHPLNGGNLSIGRDTLIPCTSHGIIKLLEFERIAIAGRRVVILGQSNIVGKPMGSLLLARNATVTICNSRTADLGRITREAEILIAAVGRPNFVTADMVSPGTVVIDVGNSRVGEKLIGDVDFGAVRKVAGAITPVPGGVGPLTIVMLLHNTLKAAHIQLEASEKGNI